MIRYCVVNGQTYTFPDQLDEAASALAYYGVREAKVYVAPYESAEDAEANAWADEVDTGTKVFACERERREGGA